MCARVWCYTIDVILHTDQGGCDGVEVKGLPPGPGFKGKLDCNGSFYRFTKDIASKTGVG